MSAPVSAVLYIKWPKGDRCVMRGKVVGMNMRTSTDFEEPGTVIVEIDSSGWLHWDHQQLPRKPRS